MESNPIPEKYKNRKLAKCSNCGSKQIRVVEAKEVGGLEGIYYNLCSGCGWNRAITFKTPKEAL